jgi:hypothetical protein
MENLNNNNNDITKIESLTQLFYIYDYDFPINDDDIKSLSALENAISYGRISVDETEDPLIMIIDVKKEYETHDGPTTEIKFKPLTGQDRLLIQNSKDDKRGSNLQKIIARKTDIKLISLSGHDSKDNGLLESICTFFL